MISYQNFYNRYNTNSSNNPNRNKGSLIARLLLRDLAHPIAYFFAKHNISANKASMLMFLLYLLSVLIFAIPAPIFGILAILLYIVGDFMDCVDGPLARYFNTVSPYGKLLDTFIHTITASVFPITFGSQLFLKTNNPLFILLGAIGASAYVLDGLWMSKTEEIIPNIVNDEEKSILSYIRDALKVFDTAPLMMLLATLLNSLQTLVNTNAFNALFFELFIFSIFATKIVYRIYAICQKTSIVQATPWKGWTK